MLLSEIINVMESFSPLELQESYDNSGLQCGDETSEIGKVLVTLDVTIEVIEEAIANRCNLIISHHPVIFKPLRSLKASSLAERIIIEAIRHNISIYSAHTNLDNTSNGVNFELAKLLGLNDIKVLSPIEGKLRKLTVYVPLAYSEKVMNALNTAGAGQMGNYKNCGFKVEGIGTFTPNELAKPFFGKAFEREEIKEDRIEVVFPAYAQNKILKAMYAEHPYEEVAYNLVSLNNKDQSAGSGAIGDLVNGMSQDDFLAHIKHSIGLKAIKFTPYTSKIEKVAVCGGSGSFLLSAALAQQATAFVSSDFKYHEFFAAESQILIADIGHYESEVHTKELFYTILTKKMPNIAILFSTINTNPVKYYL